MPLSFYTTSECSNPNHNFSLPVYPFFPSLKPTMPLSSSSHGGSPHIAFLPSAGMGHLIPFSRLAASLSELCHVTLVSVLPTVSSAESRHLTALFSSYPRIHRFDFDLPPFDSSAHQNQDPFFLRFESLCRSASALVSQLTANCSPPVSALVVDITLSSSILPVAKDLGLPCYTLFTSSVDMLSFLAYFPTYFDSKPKSESIGDVEIPGLRTIPRSMIPQALHNQNNVFTPLFLRNGRDLQKSDGVLVNTFESFEPDSLRALRSGLVQPGFPPLITIGPLMPVKIPVTGMPTLFDWLDDQPEKSVVYVSFGSRTAMSREQIRELGIGLETSGCRFLWVIKTTVVDTDEEAELEEILGKGYLERVKNRGLVIKGWVEQEQVLEHRAIGGFVSHCGWNSVTEAAAYGVKVLAWPRIGDQRVNAGLIERSGLGVWVRGWSWEGEEEMVTGEEIGRKVMEMMADERLTAAAERLEQEARKAVEIGGSSYKCLLELVRKLRG